MFIFFLSRFCPFFRTKSRKSITSETFSNRIHSDVVWCRFDLTGNCQDTNCPWYVTQSTDVPRSVFKQKDTECVKVQFPFKENIILKIESSVQKISYALMAYLDRTYVGTGPGPGPEWVTVYYVKLSHATYVGT